jgi:hypothetical protein
MRKNKKKKRMRNSFALKVLVFYQRSFVFCLAFVLFAQFVSANYYHDFESEETKLGRNRRRNIKEKYIKPLVYIAVFFVKSQ